MNFENSTENRTNLNLNDSSDIIEKLTVASSKASSNALKASIFALASFASTLIITFNLANLQSQQNEIYSEAKSTILAVSPIAKGEIERKKNESAYPINQRSIAIAGSLSLLDIKPHTAKSYLKNVSEELYRDDMEHQFFVNVASYGSPQAMVEVFATTKLKVFDRWIIDTGDESSPLLSSFPRNPTLLMNHESIAFPKCNNGDTPVLIYAKAIEKGTLASDWSVEPKILRDDNLNRWIVYFDDLDPLDEAAFERRLLVITNCNTIESE